MTCRFTSEAKKSFPDGFGTEDAVRLIGLRIVGLGGGGIVPEPFPLPRLRRELVPRAVRRDFPRPFTFALAFSSAFPSAS